MAYHLSLSPNRTAIFWMAQRDPTTYSNYKLGMRVANPDTHNYKMSVKARRRLRTAINWLVFLSAKRRVVRKSGHYMNDFQIAFVTLTLPTAQMHSHEEIKSKALNHFLTIARQKWGIENYVWKAELQSNGNIHFHLTWDKYVHYMAIRREWNQVLAGMGYIAEYKAKFSAMTFQDYQEFRAQNSPASPEKVLRAYKYGQATRWTNPNTTDVKKVDSVRNLASYLSKYLAKDVAKGDLTPEQQVSLETFTGRKWFLSRSLSSLKSLVIPYSYDLKELLKKLRGWKKVFQVFTDWVEILFYNYYELPRDIREFIRQELVSHAVNQFYPFPDSAITAGL